MNVPDPHLDPARLAEEALAGRGNVRLAPLLAALVPAEELRALARQHGLSPRGFRIERATPYAIAELLAESDLIEIVTAACALLARKGSHAALTAIEPQRGIDPIARHHEQELARLRDELDKARAAAARHRDGEARAHHEVEQLRATATQLRAAIREQQASLPEAAQAPHDADGQRAHDLEREVAGLNDTGDALRRRLAEQQARIRDLELEGEALLARIPAGKRKSTAPPPAPPPLPEIPRIPRFAESFYRSLEDKDRRAVAAALQAVLLFCVEGPTYPGLEVKRLEGAEVWSLRAARKLRVYFTLRSDGTVEVLALGDREEQHTMLRRLKDRGNG